MTEPSQQSQTWVSLEFVSNSLSANRILTLLCANSLQTGVYIIFNSIVKQKNLRKIENFKAQCSKIWNYWSDIKDWYSEWMQYV